MEFISLASSSSGNAYVVDDGKTKLLIECGISFKKLQKLMGFSVSELSGCLLSHEHKDHSKCAGEIILSGIPLYTSEGTIETLGLVGAKAVAEKEMVTVGTFDIIPFLVYHDAVEPYGFLVRSRASGKRLMFATDTAAINYDFAGLNIIVIECNYIKDILERSHKLPDKVRYRITNSHMEASAALKYILRLDTNALEKIYLCHLSDACSNEWRIRKMFEEKFASVEIIICNK